MLFYIGIDSANTDHLHLLEIDMPAFLHIFIDEGLFFRKFLISLFCLFGITRIHFRVDIRIRRLCRNGSVIHLFRRTGERGADDFSKGRLQPKGTESIV